MAKKKKATDVSIYDSIMNHVIENYGTENIGHHVGLVDDYMGLIKIKRELQADIKKRGINIFWQNSDTQCGYKKNESIGELNKTHATQIKILNQLGIKPKALNEFSGFDESL